MARGGRRRKRLSPEEGRRALLDAGRALAHEHAAPSPLEHIKVSDVADRAGVTAGALYHYWDSQDDYRDDLVEYLFSPDRYPPSSVPQLFGRLDPSTEPIEALVRQGADAEFRNLLANPELRLLMAMWAADEPSVNPRIASQYEDIGGRWSTLYEEVFRAYGLEIRPPFTFATMAALFTALGEGLVVRASLDPDAVPTDLVAGRSPDQGGDGVTWGLLGCAILALLPGLSRPAGSDEDLFALIDRLRTTGEQFSPPPVSSHE